MSERRQNEAPEQTSTMTTEEADGLRTRVRELSTEINTHTFEVGEALYKLKDEMYHLNRWGCRSIGELAEEVGIGKRKGEYLVQTFERFGILHPLPEDLDARLRKLPWTKARELARICTAENAADWIASAESLSRDDLTQRVKEAAPVPTAVSENSSSSGATTPAEEFRRRPFVLADTPDHAPDTQASVVDAALKRAAQLSGSTKDGHNLTLISTDFLATNDFGTSSGDAKLRYLAKIETLLGLRLIVVNPDGTQVIFGGETLNRLLDYLARAEPDVAAATEAVGGQQ